MKKLLCAMLIIAMLTCVFSACNNTSTTNGESDNPSATSENPATDSSQASNTEATIHTHSFGEWTIVKNATCTEDGNQERVCSCGEKESETIFGGHDYVKGFCSACNAAMFNITLPEVPSTYENKSSGTQATLTSIRYELKKHSYDNAYEITIYYEGEKTYDPKGNDHTDYVSVEARIYDSDGYSLDVTHTSHSLKVGEKFRDHISVHTELDSTKTYKIELDSGR